MSVNRKKKKYNWKARIVPANEEELTTNGGNETQSSNVPPGSAKPEKLSRRERKRLQKILQVKEQKRKRAAVIDKLQALALPSDELKMLASFNGAKRKHSHGRERKKIKKPKLEEFDGDTSDDDDDDEGDPVINTDDLIPYDTPSIDDCTTTNTSDKCTDTVATCTTPAVTFTTTTATTTTTTTNDTVQSGSATTTPAVYMTIDRCPDVQAARLLLPIISEEHSILEGIIENDVVVICGATGSGKTTQVPQFLYEAGYTLKMGGAKMIGVTQPRRVAAINMSRRVAMEMNMSSNEISYQIRYRGTSSPSTLVKFMTDGVLLKEIEKDFLLMSYSVVIIDEAHERSVYTDILIGLLSRVVPLRRKNGCPLKLIIMSATLRVEDFTQNRLLFTNPPPVINVESRQHPVTIHFNKKTPDDYLSGVYHKVCKIHRSLPAGHILVFLTGKREILQLCRKLQKTFPSKGADGRHRERRGRERERKGGEGKRESEPMNDDRDCDRSIIDLNNYPIVPSMRDDDTINSDDDDDVIMMSSDEDDDEEAESSIGDPLQVLPLYATLSPSEQAKVFQISPEGGRVCVVATNVAETSITIPHIRYVVDSGKVKRKFYDKLTGVSTFRVVWISKASADQRAGRSGRTGPGHCYRLYSSAVFQHEFPQFSEPEISQRPIDDLILQMKAMNIIKIINFPFPTPPTREALRGAEKLLISLGALDEAGLSVTGLGEAMSALPISPRYSKMLCLSRQNGCLPYMVVIVAGLSVRELFVAVGDETTPADDTPTMTGKLSATKRKWIGQGEWLMLGDLMVLLRSVGAYESSDNKLDCCRKLGLRMRAMDEARKLRHQLTNIVNVLVPDAELFMDPKMSPPTQDQAKFLRQIVLTGSGDHVARKMDTNSMNSDDQKKYRNAYECMLCDGPVYIHPSSILSNVLPQFVIFQELMETNKLYMKEVVAIEWEWLPRLLPNCCSFSKPLDGVRPSYDATEGHVTCHMTTTFGPWVLPSISLPYPAGIDRYKWFAVYLLQGDVFPPLKQFSSNLLCPPITMTKTWAKLHNRTQVLLAGLAAKEASTRDKILLIWQEEPQYLLAEYMQWLPQNKHLLIKELWPPND